jgi:hypothetical protein
MTDKILDKHALAFKHETSAFTEDHRRWSISLKARGHSGVLIAGFVLGTPPLNNIEARKYRQRTSYIKNTAKAFKFVNLLLSGIDSNEVVFLDRSRVTFHHYGVLAKQKICPLDNGCFATRQDNPRHACYEFPEHCGLSSSRKPTALVKRLIAKGDLRIVRSVMEGLVDILEHETEGEIPLI